NQSRLDQFPVRRLATQISLFPRLPRQVWQSRSARAATARLVLQRPAPSTSREPEAAPSRPLKQATQLTTPRRISRKPSTLRRPARRSRLHRLAARRLATLTSLFRRRHPRAWQSRSARAAIARCRHRLRERFTSLAPAVARSPLHRPVTATTTPPRTCRRLSALPRPQRLPL